MHLQSQSRSPFYVVEEFISPMMCEDIIDTIGFIVPDMDKDDKEIKTIRTNEQAESIIYERLSYLMTELQAYYQFIYKGMERINFEWFPPGEVGQPDCENSHFLRGKWLRTKQRDLTGVLFLSDYQDQPPFDGEFEVYGGKLEFPQHAFSFNPARGTLVVFPSDPHFINATSEVLTGDLYQARIQIASTQPYLYDPRMFPGNYASWFASHLTK